MKNCLFLCNTPYQMLFAANFAYQQKNICTYVIVTDMIADYASCAERAKGSGLFAGVCSFCIKRIERQTVKCNFVRTFLQQYGIGVQRLRQVFKEVSFDEFYCANFNYQVTALYKELAARNPMMVIYMFEDGLATYSQFYEETWKKILYPKDSFHRRTRKRLFEAFYHVQGILCFRPELVGWKPEVPLICVRGINAKDKRFVHLVSDMFGYDGQEDSYEQKIIFFEESYYGAGRDVGDMMLVEKIAQEVGKNNVFVKIHPSNPHNRFAEKGYHTNKNTTVPWEIIALNLPLEEKILVTIASVAVLTPFLLLGMSYRAIMLYKCVQDQSMLEQTILPTYERVCQQTGAPISLPLDEEAAMNMINTWA